MPFNYRIPPVDNHDMDLRFNKIPIQSIELGLGISDQIIVPDLGAQQAHGILLHDKEIYIN